MGDKPFIKFYPSDFLGGTSGLSPAERGVYITLLCLIYEADGEIARDDARLSRRCGSPKASFSRILDALICEGKLIERDGMLSNKRAKKAIVDRQNRAQNASHAARLKWSAQVKKNKQNQRKNCAGAMRAQCVKDASQSPEPEPDIKTESNDSVKKTRVKEPDLFAEFWGRYPKRVGKADAHKAYIRAMKKITHDDLMFALSERLPALEAREKKYRPNPSTWLNQERWQDDIDTDHNESGSWQGGYRNGMVDAFAQVAAERIARDGRGYGND